MNVTIILIMITALLNTAAQLLLKAGMQKVGMVSFTHIHILALLSKIILNPWIMSGLMVYVISVTLWLLVLSRVAVAVAYPMTSIAFILNAIAAYFLLGEQLSHVQIAGIAVIIFGVYLIAPA